MGSDTYPLCSHEDGTVRFWDASGVALRPLYKLSTAGLFQTDCEHADSLAQAVEDDWPPFRKVPLLPLPLGLALELKFRTASSLHLVSSGGLL